MVREDDSAIAVVRWGLTKHVPERIGEEVRLFEAIKPTGVIRLVPKHSTEVAYTRATNTLAWMLS